MYKPTSMTILSSLRSSARATLAVALVVGGAGCGGGGATGAGPAEAASEKGSGPVEATMGSYHSPRFLLSLALPGGRDWKIDDRSAPHLYAENRRAQSKLWLLRTREDELMNRQKCEARAVKLGWLPNHLTTVEDERITGPDAFDSRVLVAVGTTAGSPVLTGHVFLFGGFLRQCLLLHVSTTVPSAEQEEELSTRLALYRARIVRGLDVDAPRITTEAEVPRAPEPVRR